MPNARTRGRTRRDQAHPVGTGAGSHRCPWAPRAPARRAALGRADCLSAHSGCRAPNASTAGGARMLESCDRRLSGCPVLLRTGEVRRWNQA